MSTIFWAADSTVAFNSIRTYPQTGIGQVFGLFVKSGTEIKNYAINGRSTKSFLDEGRLDQIREEIKAGDFLFIQFGHNDEKQADPSRYTDPFGAYKTNLKIYIAAAREAGAYPVLITPLERRCFEEDGTLGKGEHGDYVKAMQECAEENQVPLVDLNAKSRKVLEQAGDEESKKYYMNLQPGIYESHPEGLCDNTHLQYAGAVAFGTCIAQGLKELGGIYQELLL